MHPFVRVPLGSPVGSVPPVPTPGRFYIPVCLPGLPPQGVGGPLEFPDYPCMYMPRSRTAVVSPRLALASPGLLPSGSAKPSAFPVKNRVILSDHNYEFFAALSHGLHTRYTWLHTHPHGYACRFTTALAAHLHRWDLYGIPYSPTVQYQPISQHPCRFQGPGFNSTRN